MTTMTFAPPPPKTALSRLKWTMLDGMVLVRRELEHLARDPGQAVGELAFPAVMVLLFGYVFGEAISVPGNGDYREYLIPGLFAMTSLTAVMVTATVVAADAGKGVMDRFRSMPMTRSAVPFGQTVSGLVTGLLSMVVMTGCALAVGWRARNGIADTAAAFGLLVLFRYATAWVGVLLGLAFKNEESAGRIVPLVFPISMLSNTYVPTDRLPTWLRFIAEWNPVSAITAACRSLFGNPSSSAVHEALPLQHPVAASLIWSIALIAICAPIAVWRFAVAGR